MTLKDPVQNPPGLSLRARVASLAGRGATVVLAYVMTSLVVLGAAIGLKGLVTPGVLAGVLSVIFISGLASALEPGTTKAMLVAGRLENASRRDIEAVALASLIKALAVSVPLGILWRVTDVNIGWAVIAWIPIICITGLLTTDLRVLLDAQGRHGSAIWLKQGGLTLGVLVLALAVAFGLSLPVAVALSCGVRVLWTAGGVLRILAREQIMQSKPAFGGAGILHQSKELILRSSWLDFMAVSVLAALSGSLDRMVALRMLTPEEYRAYYLVGELMTKMWLLPYLVAPILFARHAQGIIHRKALVLVNLAIGLTGTLYALTLIIVSLWATQGVRSALGLDAVTVSALGIYGLATVLACFNQLLVVDLQARGEARAATIMTAVSLVASICLFYPAVLWLGLNGLLLAWLAKAVLELSASIFLIRILNNHQLGMG